MLSKKVIDYLSLSTEERFEQAENYGGYGEYMDNIDSPCTNSKLIEEYQVAIRRAKSSFLVKLLDIPLEEIAPDNTMCHAFVKKILVYYQKYVLDRIYFERSEGGLLIKVHLAFDTDITEKKFEEIKLHCERVKNWNQTSDRQKFLDYFQRNFY